MIPKIMAEYPNAVVKVCGLTKGWVRSYEDFLVSLSTFESCLKATHALDEREHWRAKYAEAQLELTAFLRVTIDSFLSVEQRSQLIGSPEIDLWGCRIAFVLLPPSPQGSVTVTEEKSVH